MRPETLRSEAVMTMTEKHETPSKSKGGAAKGAVRGVSIRVIGAITTAIAVALAFYAFTIAGYVSDARETAEFDESRYVQCSAAINDLQAASDYLTTQTRMFVVTGERSCLESYVKELTVTDRRGNAVELLESSFEEGDESISKLEQALAASNDLAEKELTAMRLAVDYYQVGGVPNLIAKVSLPPDLASLDRNGKLAAAEELVLSDDYIALKDAITENVKASSQALLDDLNEGIEENDALMQSLLLQLRVAVALLLCVIMILVLVVLMYVLKPLDRYIKRIEKNEPLEVDGSYELHYLANAYNAMYEDNAQRIEQLREFAERDPLTGISNRSGYDGFLATHTRNIALLLIDIDNFKDFNKVYGRDTGDAVMVKLANALSTAFRSTDFPCRLGGDRFAVVMTSMSPDQRDAVSDKVELVNTLMADDADDLPAITLSIGIAFSAEGMNDHDIYRAADKALLYVQENGRNGLAFYSEDGQATG